MCTAVAVDECDGRLRAFARRSPQQVRADRSSHLRRCMAKDHRDRLHGNAGRQKHQVR